MRPLHHPRALSLVTTGLAVALLAAGCGGGGGDDDTQIATLSDSDTATADTGTTESTASTEDSQEALLAYAECMRGEGIDMADPTFDADGNATGGGFGPDSGIDPRSDEFQAAQETCGSLIEGVTLGGPGGGGGFDNEAMQEATLAFTECLRDEGLDVGDLELPTPGQGGGPADGATPPDGATDGTGTPGQGGPPDGAGPGNGDPSARLVEVLGLDADDPAVVAALEVCQPLLEDAFQAPADATTGTEG
jgi:hypothetical protein